MKLTIPNLKKVISENFTDIDLSSFKFSISGDVYKAYSEDELINAEVYRNDPSWAKSLVNHIKWQLCL